VVDVMGIEARRAKLFGRCVLRQLVDHRGDHLEVGEFFRTQKIDVIE
jgi:hypothetical protein